MKLPDGSALATRFKQFVRRSVSTNTTAAKPASPPAMTTTTQKPLEGVSILYFANDSWFDADETKRFFGKVNGAKIEISNTPEDVLAKLPGDFDIVIIESNNAKAIDLILRVREQTEAPIFLYREGDAPTGQSPDNVHYLKKGQTSDAALVKKIDDLLKATVCEI